MAHDDKGGHAQAGAAALALGALGVVFGDIGTSPLYAVREAIEHQHLEINRVTSLGVASLAFWALLVIVSLKYLALVMKADNHGEGGILALAALIMPSGAKRGTHVGVLAILGVFGTALLYGDGLITPAISVLSAVEGFKIASSAFEDWVLPITCVILVVLFAVQSRGTASVGKVFGPVMVAWFAVLGVLGLLEVVDSPSVLQAVNPVNIVHYFAAAPMKAFLSLGSIFLVVTGGEALYADMGHFGRKPIALAWYALVLPCLVLNYFGQAALVLADPGAIESPLYRMAPTWAITPLAILATMASVIAAQALISGAFSLTVQAVQLDFLPRIRILHTSGEHRGQVYVPLVNWALMVGTIGLVLGFRSSTALAAAYGIAVTSTMAITSMLFYVVVRKKWGWSMPKAAAVVGPLLLVDVAFLAANVPKIPDGGWFPLVVAVALLVQMATWRRGRQLVADRLRQGERTLKSVLPTLASAATVEGSAVYLFKEPTKAPPALLNNLRHNKVAHEQTVVVAVLTEPVPRVDPAERAEVEAVGPDTYGVTLRFGFMEEPDVPAALQAIDEESLVLDPATTTYFVGRESVRATDLEGMPLPLERLYVLLHRGADSAVRFFNLPPDRIFEVGTHVEI